MPDRVVNSPSSPETLLAAAQEGKGALGDTAPRSWLKHLDWRVMLALAATYISSAAYVAGGPDVVTQLRGRLPAGWRCTLAAVDGAMVGDVPRQLDRVARDATHLVVSVGGNDALRQEAVLREPARSVGEALARLAQVRDRFH